MTPFAARALFQSNWWLACTTKQQVAFQLFELRLCMPFSEFHSALEIELGRPVQTIELGFHVEELRSEFISRNPELADDPNQEIADV